MKTTLLLKPLKGRITGSKLRPDGSCEFTVESEEPAKVEVEEVSKPKRLENTYIRIEASKISLDDEFMQHNPKTKSEEELKELIRKVITSKVKDFWRPRLDPSFSEDEARICYVAGDVPAVGKSYIWWRRIAKKYNTKCRSRLGTRLEYVAFLGVLIKALISEGWDVADAWDAVCNNSTKLGHYWNSENAKNGLELTGSREICGFFDLGNTYKLLAMDENIEGFWLASGCYGYNCDEYPISNLSPNCYQNYDFDSSVGWLVFENYSTDH